MRILGIDPGLRCMGWGVIETRSMGFVPIDSGVCRSSGADLARRLLSLYTQLVEVVARTAPEAAAVEHSFVNRDGLGTLKLGQARALALLVPAQAGLPIGEYAPNTVKKTVVGVGHATKDQVAHMVRVQLPGLRPGGADAMDALAIALCHACHVRGARAATQGERQSA